MTRWEHLVAGSVVPRRAVAVTVCTLAMWMCCVPTSALSYPPAVGTPALAVVGDVPAGVPSPATVDEAKQRVVEAENALSATHAKLSVEQQQLTELRHELATVSQQLSHAIAAHNTATANLSTYAKNVYIAGDRGNTAIPTLTLLTEGPESLPQRSTAEYLWDSAGHQLITATHASQQHVTDTHVAYRTLTERIDVSTARIAALVTELATARAHVDEQRAVLRVAMETYTAALLAHAAQSTTSTLGNNSVSIPPLGTANATMIQRAKIVWDILIGQGFTPEAAAGVLGNLQQESGINPTAVQNNGPGRGLAQWSVGGRWDTSAPNLLTFASTTNASPWELSTQINFMLTEMSNGWGGFNRTHYATLTNVPEATIYFHNVYERSADSAMFVLTQRGGYSTYWYNLFRNTTPTPTLTTTPTDTTALTAGTP